MSRISCQTIHRSSTQRGSDDLNHLVTFKGSEPKPKGRGICRLSPPASITNPRGESQAPQGNTITSKDHIEHVAHNERLETVLANALIAAPRPPRAVTHLGRPQLQHRQSAATTIPRLPRPLMASTKVARAELKPSFATYKANARNPTSRPLRLSAPTRKSRHQPAQRRRRQRHLNQHHASRIPSPQSH